MKVYLSILVVKNKEVAKPVPVLCDLNISTDGKAFAMVRSSIVASMERTTLDLMGANGFLLTGFEKVNKAYYYQRWWIRAAGDEK